MFIKKNEVTVLFSQASYNYTTTISPVDWIEFVIIFLHIKINLTKTDTVSTGIFSVVRVSLVCFMPFSSKTRFLR